jgi:hypothetical protein
MSETQSRVSRLSLAVPRGGADGLQQRATLTVAEPLSPGDKRKTNVGTGVLDASGSKKPGRPLQPKDVVLDLESPRTRAAITMLGLEREDLDPEVAPIPGKDERSKMEAQLWEIRRQRFSMMVAEARDRMTDRQMESVYMAEDIAETALAGGMSRQLWSQSRGVEFASRESSRTAGESQTRFVKIRMEQEVMKMKRREFHEAKVEAHEARLQSAASEKAAQDKEKLELAKTKSEAREEARRKLAATNLESRKAMADKLLADDQRNEERRRIVMAEKRKAAAKRQAMRADALATKKSRDQEEHDVKYESFMEREVLALPSLILRANRASVRCCRFFRFNANTRLGYEVVADIFVNSVVILEKPSSCAQG